MFAIVYVSTAVRRPTAFDLQYLLVDARTYNAVHGVTGALLLHELTFFQYFEGPRVAVLDVYERIKAASLHRGIVELSCEPVPTRHFDGWHMGFAETPRGVLLQLAQARWQACVDAEATHLAQPEGVQLLLDFWRRRARQVPQAGMQSAPEDGQDGA
jgi:hypothetical protein